MGRELENTLEKTNEEQFVDRSFSVWQLARGLCAAVSLALCSMLLAPRSAVEAQQAKIPRVGFLRSLDDEDIYIEAFRQELKKLGYVEGENIALEYRSGKPDQLPKLAADLVDLQVAIILADG